MTTVRIPQPMQSYTGQQEIVHASGKNVRQIIHALDNTYPGLKSALMNEGKLKPDVAVIVDGNLTRLGLLQPVNEESEILFVPAISGG